MGQKIMTWSDSSVSCLVLATIPHASPSHPLLFPMEDPGSSVLLRCSIYDLCPATSVGAKMPRPMPPKS